MLEHFCEEHPEQEPLFQTDEAKFRLLYDTIQKLLKDAWKGRQGVDTEVPDQRELVPVTSDSELKQGHDVKQEGGNDPVMSAPLVDVRWSRFTDHGLHKK